MCYDIKADDLLIEEISFLDCICLINFLEVLDLGEDEGFSKATMGTCLKTEAMDSEIHS